MAQKKTNLPQSRDVSETKVQSMANLFAKLKWCPIHPRMLEKNMQKGQREWFTYIEMIHMQVVNVHLKNKINGLEW